MYKLFIAFVFLLFSWISKSQTNQIRKVDQNNYIENKVDSIKNYYSSKTFNPLGYINGKEYKHYHLPTQSSPYLNSQGVGSIFMDGVKYDNLNLIYDIYLDELITVPVEYSAQSVFININKSLVDSFQIYVDDKNYNFKNIKINNYKSTGITDGFYETIYSGNFSLIQKHIKTSSQQNSLTIYKKSEIKYLFINGKYHDISTRKKLFSLFKDNIKKLRKKYKQTHTLYKDLQTSQLVELVKYAETL